MEKEGTYQYFNSRLFGGWLTTLETREEWACIEHWVENAYKPVFQRFAISMRADFTQPGQYLWEYPDGSTAYPEYDVWATDHPRDLDCVSMMIGSGVDHQGLWVDGDCYSDPMWAICEKM